MFMDSVGLERERGRHRGVERLRNLWTNNGKLMDELNSSTRFPDRLGGKVPDRKSLMENVVIMDRDRGSREKVDMTDLDRDKRKEKSDGKSGLRFSGSVNVLERMRALDREREEERERIRERGREDEQDDDKEKIDRDELLQELVSQYKTALGELTFNSKPIITNLTIIAGENAHASKGIANTVCSHILEVPKEQKLPALYLLDSIVKNIGADYVRHFAARLTEVFSRSYKQADPATHPSMQHLFRTWRGVFPASSLRRIESELEFAPQSNGPSTTTLPAKSVDPSSHRTGHVIHVNPKYVEAQRQRLQQTVAVEGAPVEVAGPRESNRSAVHESNKRWPDTALSRSPAERVGPFDKSTKGQASASEHSDQTIMLGSPGAEISSRRGIHKEILEDRKWTLDREQSGKSGRVSDPLSSQRNGLDWRMASARESSLEELCSSRLGPLYSQAIDKSKLSMGRSVNWPNSEEEQVGDEMSSSQEYEHDSGAQREEKWNSTDLEKSFRTTPIRENWSNLQTDFSETLHWRRYSVSNHLEQPLGFDDRLPSFQELDSRLHRSASHLMKGPGGWQGPISGDVLAMNLPQAGHFSDRHKPPLSMLQHFVPPESRLRSLQVTVPALSAPISNVNLANLSPPSDFATHSPTRLRSMLLRPSKSFQKSYQPNISASLGMGSATIGHLSPVTPGLKAVLQAPTQLQPSLPSFSTVNFSSQHISPVPFNPPATKVNIVYPSHNLTPASTFQQPNPLKPFQVLQPLHKSQEVAMPGQTFQALEPPQLPSIQGSHSRRVPLVEALAPLQEDQQQMSSPLLQQPQNLQVFRSQTTQPQNNSVSGVMLNGPALAPSCVPVDQPKEDMLAAFFESGLMPPAQNSLLQSQPQPSSSMVIATFLPTNTLPSPQAPPPLPTGPPPFQFSAAIVNSMAVQAFSSGLTSSHSLPQITPATAFGTFPLQYIQNLPPPLPPGPPPSFAPVQSGAVNPAAIGEPGSVNQLSSLLSSLVAHGLIASPVSSAGATVSVSTPMPPPMFLPVLQSSDFSFVSTDAAQVSDRSQSVVSVATTTSIPLFGEDADHDDSLDLVDVGTKFMHDILKERHESVVNSLYSDLPRQCKTCGLRFYEQEDHSKHMDWHVTRNRQKKSQKTISRSLFVSAKEWLGGVGVRISVAAPFFVEEIEAKVEEEETLAVPADENQSACALCQEPFEDFYCDETEEWMYKGAVYSNVPLGSSAEGLDSSLRGPIVHAKCKSESAAITVGKDSFEDVKEEPKDEFKSRKRVRY